MKNAKGKSKEPSAALVLLGEDHSGRDEMNLAANPFALLQAASKSGQTYLAHEWERRLPNGKIVTASWEVNGDAKLGMPGPNEELLYLALMQLTRETAGEGVWPQIVHFSRIDLLNRLGWSDNARDYQTLSNCFARLQAVSIRAHHSFYDARIKAPYESIGFALIDTFAIATEKRGHKSQTHIPVSWFEWNSVIHASFVAGNMRSLALEFTLSLETPTAQRLFRLLELFRHAEKPARISFSIGIWKLRDRLGMTPYKYVSKVKEKLAGAIGELVERGYLESVEWNKTKEGEEMALFRFNKALVTQDEAQTPKARQIEAQIPKTGRVGVILDTQSSPIGISVGGASPQTLERAKRCHALFLSLPSAEQDRLRSIARENVPSVFWDRLESPDSPMAFNLWDLVEEVK